MSFDALDIYSDIAAAPQCDCPFQICTVDTEYVTFQNINRYLKYFVLVSRDEDGAIYGVVPAPMSCNDQSVPIATFHAPKKTGKSRFVATLVEANMNRYCSHAQAHLIAVRLGQDPQGME